MKRATTILFGIILLAGCDASSDAIPQSKAPRAVTVMRLAPLQPDHRQTMAGSVAAWKTEQIGFEVAGRVTQVIEPNTVVEARILDRSGKEILANGTVLARLDDQRYQIALDTARSALAASTERWKSLQIEIAQGIPARIRAAQAERELAQAELDRQSSLVARNAVSESVFDRAKASLETATANVEILEADVAAKQSEIQAVIAQRDQSQLQLEKAELDHQDATLYSFYRGQVAEVHAVPGSYVAVGDPVVTVQMMDPMKVELEVSASLSRKFRYGDAVRLIGSDRNHRSIPLAGFVYRTDPIADPDTRTFTVTLLVRNQQLQPEIPAELTDPHPARTTDVWPLNIEPIVGGGVALMVEAKAIRHDAQGAFLWKVMNRHSGEVPAHRSRVLDVTKVRVTPGHMKIPFLGNWSFVPVTAVPGEQLDPERDLVAGQVIVDGGDGEAWDGKQLLLDRSGWMLRPGDLVSVVLPNGDMPSGYYVPMKAIRHEAGETFVFIHQADDGCARRVNVRLAEDTYSSGGKDVLRRIEPVEPSLFANGASLIVEGVHYLKDGEPIVAVERMEDVQ